MKGTHTEVLYASAAFGDADEITKAVPGDDELTEAPPFHLMPDRYEILEWDYAEGDAVLFNSRIVHSSGGNASPTLNRIAYSTRWIGDDARFRSRQGWTEPHLLPDEDESIEDGDLLTSRKFQVAWRAAGSGSGAERSSLHV